MKTTDLLQQKNECTCFGGLCLGEGLRHGAAVFRIKKVYMHGQAQILSQVSHALFRVNVISFRVVIRIHI